MNDQHQNGKLSTSRRKGRGCLFWLGASLATLLGLLLVGYIVEPLAEAADAKAYSPPGQLVDVGGYRLHINCTGTGGPTVVIVAGLGDWSTTWGGHVQPEVAKSTRVCTYDRPGLGWSEAVPLPGDAAQFARELHTLLQNANIPGPYVMVGHSLGGFVVRIFAHDYASEVSGVVLVDSMNPKQVTQSLSGKLARLYSLQAVLARFGIGRLLVKLPAIAPSMPPNEAAYYPLYIRPQSLQASASEYQGLPASAAEAAAVKSFDDLPLIVLTAKLNDNPGWTAWQTELLQLSSHSQHLFAENSGHTIQIDEPKAAVAADGHRVLLRLRVALRLHRGNEDGWARTTRQLAPVPARRRLQEIRPFAAGAPLNHYYVIGVDAPRMVRQVPAGFPEHALPPARTFYWKDAHDPAKTTQT
jgi:pimeloyl-ACP methyl ester carboxylesterase